MEKLGWPIGIQLDSRDSDYLERLLKREKELRRDADTRFFISHRMFHAMPTQPNNHRLLNGGIAPWDWKGWNVHAPMLGVGCSCALIGINRVRARRLIASGEGFDLTKGVPDGAGPDKGWVRQFDWWEKLP